MIYLLLKKLKNIEFRWIVFGSVLGFIFKILVVKVLSSLGKEMYGFHALVGSLVAVGNLYIGPFSQGFLRYYHNYKNSGKMGIFLEFYSGFILFSVFIFSFIALIAILFVSKHYEYGIPLLVSSAIYVIIFLIKENIKSMLNNLRARKEAILIGSISTSLIVILTWSLLFKIKEIYIYYVIFSIVSFGAILIMVKYLSIKNFNLNKHSFLNGIKNCTDILKYIKPFFIWGIFGWVQSYGERWIILSKLSISDLGAYSLMLGICFTGISFIYGLITNYYTPIIFQKSSKDITINGKKQPDEIINYYKITILLFFLFVIFICFFKKQIILILSSIEYVQYMNLMPFIAISTALFYTAQTLTILGQSVNISQKYLFPKIIPGILIITFGFFASFKYGLQGIVILILISNIVYLLLTIRANKKIKHLLNDE